MWYDEYEYDCEEDEEIWCDGGCIYCYPEDKEEEEPVVTARTEPKDWPDGSCAEPRVRLDRYMNRNGSVFSVWNGSGWVFSNDGERFTKLEAERKEYDLKKARGGYTFGPETIVLTNDQVRNLQIGDSWKLNHGSVVYWHGEQNGWQRGALADWEIELLQAEQFFNEQAAKEGPDVLAVDDVPIEELEVNEKGGKQTKLSTRYDLIPQAAQHKVAEVLAEGNDKYGERNWRKIDERSHLNHALAHANAFLFHRAEVNAGKTPVDRDYLVEELSHAAARALMALEILLVGEDE